MLTHLNILTIKDLLYYFPRNYFDSSKVYKIKDLNHQEKKTFKARILTIKSNRTRKRNFTIQTAVAEDDEDAIEMVWFNQPFLVNTLIPDKEYIFSGKLSSKSYKAQIQSPEFEDIKEDQVHLGRITPIYALTERLSNKWIRSRIKWLVEKCEYITDLEETLPEEIIKKYELNPLTSSLINVHFPTSKEMKKNARYRLAFEELLYIQIKVLKQLKALNKLKAPVIKSEKKFIQNFIDNLPYKLTSDQEIAVQEILEDLGKGKPMNRLLSGDVGSGKTIVAIIAALVTVKAGYQATIMAPTTILADQHYSTFTSMLKKQGLVVKLVSSNSKTSDFNGDIIIGTQAILFKKHELFHNLGLIVIDEQHRFGVEQREELFKTFTKNQNSVHMLDMTATPIPRTLAMTLFGNLQVSTIKHKPGLRPPVKTFLVPNEKRENGLSWIQEKANQGIQVFWITPLIEESEKVEAASVEKTYKELKQALPKLNIEYLHGKIKPKEKQLLLEKFRDYKKNKINILVSTSVIEVGIDIPNANVIVIEGAERFGLAQLHQLRGRVGRSDEESWCFMFTSNDPNQDQLNRLEYFTKENNGFKLAEFDLERRGPGEVYGIKQSGIPDLKIANIFDIELVKKTREAAEILI